MVPWVNPVTPDDIAAAAARIAPHIVKTPVIDSAALGILIKSEHRQHTGSFKLRGALNKILLAKVPEVYTASSGNHGIAVATAAKLTGTRATVYLPAGASPAKVDRIRLLGAEIVGDCASGLAAETMARSTADERGLPYLSPYNDPDVIAGQGTIAIELAEQVKELDEVVVAVGGGGLISGVSTWLAHAAPDIKVIGASPVNDAAMHESVAANEIVDVDARPTFSDGTAGGLELNSITFEICRAQVHEWNAIGEQAIASGVAAMIDHEHDLVEGAAGMAVSVAMSRAQAEPEKRIAAISCGANVSSAALLRMLAEANAGS